jgi:hypothetical protein
VADRKIPRFEKNITKWGSIPKTIPETVKKGNDYPVAPIMLRFFLSSLLLGRVSFCICDVTI